LEISLITLKRRLQSLSVLFVLFFLIAAALAAWAGSAFGSLPAPVSTTLNNLSIFSAIFLGIFIEAAPYLLMGTLASGLVEVFFKRDEIAALFPRKGIVGALVGSSLGLFFPVCECGVVPLTRRLFQKGMPPSMGISFLLAAPVLNPITIASTYAAFGAGPELYWRMGLAFFVAVSTGLIFSLQADQMGMLRTMPVPAPAPVFSPDQQQKEPVTQRLRRMMIIAGDEFFEMGRYLVLGSLLAALMQTFVPQNLLMAAGQGPLLSVFVMVLIAVLLSVCSTVDAFISLAFVNTFSFGSILAFLVYGPMVDIKSTLLYLRVFKTRTVVYLVTLPLLITVIASAMINYFGNW
jgi:uncharacterized protein